jgi:hypothetical protein
MAHWKPVIGTPQVVFFGSMRIMRYLSKFIVQDSILIMFSGSLVAFAALNVLPTARFLPAAVGAARRHAGSRLHAPALPLPLVLCLSHANHRGFEPALRASQNTTLLVMVSFCDVSCTLGCRACKGGELLGRVPTPIIENQAYVTPFTSGLRWPESRHVTLLINENILASRSEEVSMHPHR